MEALQSRKAGDALPVETGRRLSAVIREYDVVAGMGGDEFAVLLPEMRDRTSIDAVCARVIQVLANPVCIQGQQTGTSPSMGVAIFPDHGETWQPAYKAADVALHHVNRDVGDGNGTIRTNPH